MLWIKAFHLFFMVSWFAGLLYLPRLYVYHATTSDTAGRLRFCTMEKRLFAIMTMGAAGTIVLGVWLMLGWWWPLPPGSGWLWLKLLLVLALVVFHVWCWQLMQDFRHGLNGRSDRFYRLINEIPAVLLVAILILAVVKPF